MLNTDEIVVTGDFNTVLDSSKDRSGSHKFNNHPQAFCEIQEMAASFDLVDIWRLLNTNAIRYTWRRGRQASRIDYFLILFSLVPRIQECFIGESLKSITVWLHYKSTTYNMREDVVTGNSTYHFLRMTLS